MSAQRAGSMSPGRIGRRDIEAKLEQIRHQVEHTTDAAKPAGAAVWPG